MRNQLYTHRLWMVVTGMLVGLLLLGPGSMPAIAASTPGEIMVQGRLLDGDGDPVDFTGTITIRYYDVVSGGTFIAREIQTSQTITDGKYNIALGSGSLSIIDGYTSLVLMVEAETDVWFSIEIGSDGEMAPRAKFHCAPHALQAELVGGKEGAELLTTTSTTETKDGGLILNFGVFDEQASNPHTATATKGSFWLKNNAAQSLIFEDDAGTDTVLAGPMDPAFLVLSGSGAATLPTNVPQAVTLTIKAASGTSDTMDTLSAGFAGQVVTLKAFTGHTITLTNQFAGGSDDMYLPGSTSATLTGDDRIMLQMDSNAFGWFALSYRDN